METVKNVVASVNEGVASMAQSAQESLGTVHDKVSHSCRTTDTAAVRCCSMHEPHTPCFVHAGR